MDIAACEKDSQGIAKAIHNRINFVGQAPFASPRNGDFEPQLVKKRQKRLPGFDEKVIALYARGPGQIHPHKPCYHHSTFHPANLPGHGNRLVGFRCSSDQHRIHPIPF